MRLFKKCKTIEPSPLQTVGAYEPYYSLADPLYRPYLEDGPLAEDLTRLKEDLPLTYPIDEFARAVQYTSARQALSIPGDFIECGVYFGACSHLLGLLLDRHKSDKTLWGFDSFEGLSKPNDNDLDVRTGKQFFHHHALNEPTYESVKELLSVHTCPIELVKGWIPHTFDIIKDKTFSFVYIDVDLYQPVKDCLEFLYPRLEKGGIMIIDDYGFPMTPGARKAANEFFADKKESLIPFPTGQAMIIKH
ncbi:MAG: class I SAM-dependent methyltransferase [Chlamydiales bacterium]|nr:class I SAM-dependent methyltransferase [Chlamydiales bacterium]